MRILLFFLTITILSCSEDSDLAETFPQMYTYQGTDALHGYRGFAYDGTTLVPSSGGLIDTFGPEMVPYIRSEYFEMDAYFGLYSMELLDESQMKVHLVDEEDGVDTTGVVAYRIDEKGRVLTKAEGEEMETFIGYFSEDRSRFYYPMIYIYDISNERDYFGAGRGSIDYGSYRIEDMLSFIDEDQLEEGDVLVAAYGELTYLRN